MMLVDCETNHAGDMLRAAIAANTPLGQQVKGVMAAGQVGLPCVT